MGLGVVSVYIIRNTPAIGVFDNLVSVPLPDGIIQPGIHCRVRDFKAVVSGVLCCKDKVIGIGILSQRSIHGCAVGLVQIDPLCAGFSIGILILTVFQVKFHMGSLWHIPDFDVINRAGFHHRTILAIGGHIELFGFFSILITVICP